MEAEACAYSQRKRRNFVHLNTQTFDRWQKLKTDVTKEKSFFSDSDFAGYLIEKFEEARAVISEKEIQKDLHEEITRNTRFARGTQVLHIPRDLKHELDKISVQSGLHSTVKTVRFLVDAFHDKVPEMKMKIGNGKKGATVVSGIWDAADNQPGVSSAIPDNSMQSIIKNVIDVLEAEDKGTIQTIDATDPTENNDEKAMIVENVTVKVNNGTLQEAGLKAKDDATEHSIDVRVKRDENMIEIGPSAGQDIWSSMILEQVILGDSSTGEDRAPDDADVTSNKRLKQSEPEERIYQCNTCAEIVTEAADIENHVYDKHGAMPFICRLCQLCLPEEEDMIEHVDTAHSAIYLCGFAGCNYSAAREFSIRGHFITTHTRGTRLPVSILKGKLWDMYVNRRTTFYGLKHIKLS